MFPLNFLISNDFAGTGFIPYKCALEVGSTDTNNPKRLVHCVYYTVRLNSTSTGPLTVPLDPITFRDIVPNVPSAADLLKVPLGPMNSRTQ